MNYCWNQFHLVCAYGAFGSITKKRYEIVIEGTQDKVITPKTVWKEYEFKAKPDNVHRTPPQVAPYHLRLDWLMWFLPFSVSVTSSGIFTHGYELWFLRFLKRLLEADQQTLKLIRKSPFGKEPPRFIRARYYLYHFTNWKEKRESKAIWKRELIDEYFPPVNLDDLKLQIL